MPAKAKPPARQARTYDSRQWRGRHGLRALHLAQPENQVCRCGCGRLALQGVAVDHPAKAVVDHDVPIAKAPERRLDPTNLRTYRKECHDRVKAQVERRGYHDGLDADGLPTDPNHPWRRETR